MYQLYLKPHREEPLLRHHPWVFSGALQRSKESIPLGATVTILNHDGSQRLGQGVYEGGTIAVRMLTFGEEEIGEWRAFFTTRLSQAHQLRKTFLQRQDERPTNCWRLCYGESDFIPGLVIDIYREVAVIQIHALSLYPLRQLIAEVLCELPELGVHYVYDKSVETLPAQTPSDWIMPNGYLGKAPSAEYDRTVQEYGYSFMPDWERGQKTGFFVDQRDNRHLVESYARGAQCPQHLLLLGGLLRLCSRRGCPARRLDRQLCTSYLTLRGECGDQLLVGPRDAAEARGGRG